MALILTKYHRSFILEVILHEKKPLIKKIESAYKISILCNRLGDFKTHMQTTLIGCFKGTP